MNVKQTATWAGCLIVVAATGASAATVTIDPATPITDYASLGEWETEGDFEGWIPAHTQNPDAVVSNGVLLAGSGPNPGVPSATDPQISQVFTDGPDLSDAANKTIEIRLQIETGVVTRVDMFYGTSVTPGVSGARRITIPDAQVSTDGEFHVYQIQMSDESAWQGNLQTLRLDPIAGGVENLDMDFAFDYVRIGGTVVSSTVVSVDNALIIDFESEANKTYELQATSELPSNTWTGVSAAAGTGGTVSLVAPATTADEVLFRVEIK